MCLATNIFSRNGVYYIRVRVPKDLVDVIGCKQIWKSLRTKEPSVARRLQPAAMEEMHRKFDAARAQRMGVQPDSQPNVPLPPKPTTELLLTAAREYYAAELRADDRERINGPVPGFAELRAMSAQMQRADLGMGGNVVHVAHAVDDIFGRMGWHVRPALSDDPDPVVTDDPRPIIRRDHPSYVEAAMWFGRAKAEAAQRFAERDGGDFGGTPRDPILIAPPTPAAVPTPPPEPTAVDSEETVAKLHLAYLSERQDISGEWAITNRAVLRTFVEYIGAETPVKSITKRDIRKWKELLLQYPSRGTLRGDKGTFLEIIERNKIERRETISPRTINKYLSVVRSFMKWCIDNDYIDDSPVGDISVPDSSDDDKRDPFTIEQLNRLFSSPLFTGCAGDAYGGLTTPGPIKLNDHRFWLPLLSLYSGARMSELAQLTLSDIQTLSGIDCININTINGKKVKAQFALGRHAYLC